MGDIADMMLCGILCEGCGVYVGEDVGYPVRCGSCIGPNPPKKKVPCPVCGKRVNMWGVKDHMRDAHKAPT